MRAVVITKHGPPSVLKVQDRPDPPPPSAGQVRISVRAAGVNFADHLARVGLYPDAPKLPSVVGYEVAGTIEAVGDGVEAWKAGDRVGVGWFGGNCRECDPCRRGDFINCRLFQIPGISYDGGYAAHVIAPVEALAHIPDVLRPEEAAPLMCAGITTFNALRHSGAGPGDLVAIQGIGGLGHLGIQFAAKFDTIGSLDRVKGDEYVPANTLDLAAQSKMKRPISLKRRPVDVARPSASAKPFAVPIPHL